MIRPLVTLLAAASLTACSMAPHYIRPELPAPPSWPVGDAYLRQSEAALPAISYSDIFRDARLQRIIEQALANNRDLRIAAANIASARAQYHIQRAELLPELDASGGYRYARSATGSSSSTTTTGTSNRTGSNFSADIGITSFELDLFGRVRSLTSAAQDRYFGTEAAARATRLTLVGDIATAWLTYANDKSLLKIAQDTAASAQRSVTLTKARLDGGVAPRTDLDQASNILQTALSDVALQTTATAQDINALQLLVGAPVDPALLPASIEEAAPTVAELPAGLDSAILLRRPDVVQAEYELRAANAEIGAARAALFPRISLTALLGFASSGLSNLFTSGAFNYSVAPSVSYPIFRAGAGKATVAQSQSQRDAALATYEKSIQTAFREVADALARRGTIADQERAQRALTAAAGDNYKLSEARYRGGIDTFLASLDAQRSYYSAQRTLAATELTKATNLVTLYRTLGGDARLDTTPDGPRSGVEAATPR
ncbi:efflux transporter outer membrane subunit [Sphingomonas sp. AR_OL41]|uniref:efflux transporter outer membrane subunit n=1 Tax=Sphingomonas sp. AR_OL41 TaxID=3042729 RepID=UPI00247FFB6F|nr:efflux transporter outer membrane subunit [Sphingomonas sp. AR_OL41]MDH7971806.1 efflux transporter outer membrane subunit [Sphingomonas sp. AR_OL41]